MFVIDYSTTPGCSFRRILFWFPTFQTPKPPGRGTLSSPSASLWASRASQEGIDFRRTMGIPTQPHTRLGNHMWLSSPSSHHGSCSLPCGARDAKARFGGCPICCWVLPQFWLEYPRMFLRIVLLPAIRLLWLSCDLLFFHYFLFYFCFFFLFVFFFFFFFFWG